MAHLKQNNYKELYYNDCTSSPSIDAMMREVLHLLGNIDFALEQIRGLAPNALRETLFPLDQHLACLLPIGQFVIYKTKIILTVGGQAKLGIDDFFEKLFGIGGFALRVKSVSFCEYFGCIARLAKNISGEGSESES